MNQSLPKGFTGIKGYEDYYGVNKKGEIYSLFTNKILKQSVGDRYVVVTLKGKTNSVHRVVAEPLKNHVKEIKELAAKGRSYVEIGRMFGVTNSAIGYVVRGISY